MLKYENTIIDKKRYLFNDPGNIHNIYNIDGIYILVDC